MTLGKDELVPSLHLGILRIYVHFIEVKSCNDICSRKRAARMPGSGIVDSL